MRSYLLTVISHIYNIISCVISPFIKINNRAILFWSWKSKQYNCNPRAISDYICLNHPGEFKIYWSFKNEFPNDLPPDIIPLKWGSLKYLYYANKCKYLISNTRNDIESMLFSKRSGQVYIMTWHAGMSLKKIEKDAEDILDSRYIKRAINDSKICNLMLSGSDFQTRLIRKSFWYNGEILEKGSPRNDVLFHDNIYIRNEVMSPL